MTNSSPVRYALLEGDGGYRIIRECRDDEFDPPIWVSGGFLNSGRWFPTREAARDFMLSQAER